MQGMSASSSLNFTVNSIPLRWYVFYFKKSNTGLLTSIHYFQYWGWCKYHYHQEDKLTFANAKHAALKYLNSCPVEVIVIHWFINCSSPLLSTYWMGLTGRATAWAVWKQRQHQQISQSALMTIEAMLNPS